MAKADAYRIDIPIYDLSVYVYIGETIKKSAKALNKAFPGMDLKLGNDINAYAIKAEHDQTGDALFAILLKRAPLTTTSIATITHEAYHITNYLTEYIGIKQDFGNDEAQAYMLGFIVEQILDVYTSYTGAEEPL